MKRMPQLAVKDLLAGAAEMAQRQEGFVDLPEGLSSVPNFSAEQLQYSVLASAEEPLPTRGSYSHTHAHSQKQTSKLSFHNPGGQRSEIKVPTICLIP